MVAVFLLFVVGAMAALSIDAVTLYTARSEAQLAADAAALAAARVLANSGATSDTTGTLLTNVEDPSSGAAKAVAVQVAEQNRVGGAPLTSANVTAVTFGGSTTNPTVTVRVQVTTLPAFFARIWGTTQFTVAASATAEAYNPSSVSGISSTNPPVAPICVKPWLLPNIDPSNPPNAILVAATGTPAPTATGLLGWETPPPAPGAIRLRSNCAGTGSCSTADGPNVWRYYPGTTDPLTGDFPAPSNSSVACCTGLGFINYQLSVAGCVQTPVACNQKVNVDTTPDLVRDIETGAAVNGMTHSSSSGAGDSVDTSPASPPGGTSPFQFVAGTENPVVLSGALTAPANVVVSDSLVTVPIIDTATWPPTSTTFPQVQIIGFLQLFLDPDGNPADLTGQIRTRVINIVGCGDGPGGAGVPPILGNGASPVAVRLINPTP